MLFHDDKKFGKGVNSLVSELIMTIVFGLPGYIIQLFCHCIGTKCAMAQSVVKLTEIGIR